MDDHFDTEDAKRRDGETVADVWTYVKQAYRVTKRDIARAYGGSERLARINEIYETHGRTSVLRVVLLIEPDRPPVPGLWRYANSLCRRHGVLIVSLVWLREMSEETDNSSLRLETFRSDGGTELEFSRGRDRSRDAEEVESSCNFVTTTCDTFQDEWRARVKTMMKQSRRAETTRVDNTTNNEAVGSNDITRWLTR